MPIVHLFKYYVSPLGLLLGRQASPGPAVIVFDSSTRRADSHCSLPCFQYSNTPKLRLEYIYIHWIISVLH